MERSHDLTADQAREIARRALRVPGFEPSNKGNGPPLWRINGCGFTLLGSSYRETGTVIKMLWLTILFVPIMPFYAYEVVPVAGGYRIISSGNLMALIRYKRLSTLTILATAYIEGAACIALLFAVLAAAYAAKHALI